MTTMTYTDALTQFKSSNWNQNNKLLEAVVNQLGDEEVAAMNFKDIANHGIDGGFGGFIYYKDTVEFATSNLQVIKEVMNYQHEDLGYDGIYSMIASFNCLDVSVDEVVEAMMDSDDENHTTVMNAIAWYAGEEVARWFSDFIEDENIELIES